MIPPTRRSPACSPKPKDSSTISSAAIDGSANLLNRLAPDTADTAALTEASAMVDSLQQQAASAEGFDSETFVADARSMAETTEQLTTIDPAVLVRPFTVDTSSVIPTDIDPTDYFTPAALALLLQHLALTFAALSLVRDRSTGLFELLRIGPLSSMQILFGKCAAYLIVGSAVAAALTASATFWLGVPFSGEVAWFAAMVVGVLLASLALGMVLSSISSTESQAVQFAMLTLLAGMFFSGFILGLDNLAYPVKLHLVDVARHLRHPVVPDGHAAGRAAGRRGRRGPDGPRGGLRFDRRVRPPPEPALEVSSPAHPGSVAPTPIRATRIPVCVRISVDQCPENPDANEC